MSHLRLKHLKNNYENILFIILMLSKVLRNRNISLETKKRVLHCYVISILLYGSECWTIFSQIKNRLEVTEMWFYRC